LRFGTLYNVDISLSFPKKLWSRKIVEFWLKFPPEAVRSVLSPALAEIANERHRLRRSRPAR
jgi:hypothetical protein